MGRAALVFELQFPDFVKLDIFKNLQMILVSFLDICFDLNFASILKAFQSKKQ